MTVTGLPVKTLPGDTVHATARPSCAPDKWFSRLSPANLALFALRNSRLSDFSEGMTVTN
jgi:hypothetical protein